MGFNNALNDQDHETKEKYYIFTLAAYIVKWMAKNEKDSNTKELVERNCSKGMACLFHLSNMIVNDYEYLKP